MLRAHKKSNNSLPQLSYIPTCFYGEEANLFWHTRDYSRNDVWASHMTKEEYMSGLKNLPGNDFYKYPKCKKFSPKPTDSAICHTFNGLELSKILKSSSWRENFLDAFTQGETPETLRSTGVDYDSGLMFSLDTMQSYLITKRERSSSHEPVNSFWIKLHQPGELPWVEQDKSSWHKMESHQDDMVTYFITIKGEKVANTVNTDRLHYLKYFQYSWI